MRMILYIVTLSMKARYIKIYYLNHFLRKIWPKLHYRKKNLKITKTLLLHIAVPEIFGREKKKSDTHHEEEHMSATILTP